MSARSGTSASSDRRRAPAFGGARSAAVPSAPRASIAARRRPSSFAETSPTSSAAARGAPVRPRSVATCARSSGDVRGFSASPRAARPRDHRAAPDRAACVAARSAASRVAGLGSATNSSTTGTCSGVPAPASAWSAAAEGACLCGARPRAPARCRGAELAEHPGRARRDGGRDRALEQRGELRDGGGPAATSASRAGDRSSAAVASSWVPSALMSARTAAGVAIRPSATSAAWRTPGLRSSASGAIASTASCARRRPSAESASIFTSAMLSRKARSSACVARVSPRSPSARTTAWRTSGTESCTLPDERDDRAAVAEPRERARDLGAHVRRRVVELAGERRDGFRRSGGAERVGARGAHLLITVPERAGERLHRCAGSASPARRRTRRSAIAPRARRAIASRCPSPAPPGGGPPTAPPRCGPRRR